MTSPSGWRARLTKCSPAVLAVSMLVLVTGGCTTSSRSPIGRPEPVQVGTVVPQDAFPSSPGAMPAPVAALETALVEVDYTAQRMSLVEAVQSGTHPERLSLLLAPAPFDLASYLHDPAAYLNIIEPGRALQAADPAPGVPSLDVVGPDLVTIAELGTTTLAVRTVPRGPASFASLDMGAFANGQSAITVQADDQGIARTTYTATRGTIAQSRISVSSPVASGTRGYRIEITAAGTAP